MFARVVGHIDWRLRAHYHARVAWRYAHPKPPGVWYVWVLVLKSGWCSYPPWACSTAAVRLLQNVPRRCFSLGTPPRLDLRFGPTAEEPSPGSRPALFVGLKLVCPERLGRVSGHPRLERTFLAPPLGGPPSLRLKLVSWQGGGGPGGRRQSPCV